MVAIMEFLDALRIVLAHIVARVSAGLLSFIPVENLLLLRDIILYIFLEFDRLEGLLTE